MDEEIGAKAAPVTRLRRRLSVEQPEDSKSPAPATPTKKRATRAAKPQLELIEENAPEKTPNKRTTRKSIAREVVEEEKPLTPARRSARIRSNTSIISDTPQTYDSPRAKRATRRTSQVGSDSEAPSQVTTPARARRTRKNSATNDDKQVDTTLITDVISEEPEIAPSKLSKTPENIKDKTISPNSPRKSTRLQGKRLSSNVDEESSIKVNEKHEMKTPAKPIPSETTETTKTPDSTKQNTLIEASSKTTENNDISVHSRNLIEESSKKQPSNVLNVHNKSLSALKETSNKKRTRTKSWTTMSMSPSNDCNFFSDNETIKKKVKGRVSINDIKEKTGSGDGILNNSLKHNISTKADKEIVLNTSVKKKKKHPLGNDARHHEETLNSLDSDSTEKVNNDLKADDNTERQHIINHNVSDTQKLFQSSPEAIQAKVYVEDSDSNTEMLEKPQLNEDQCVPDVPHVFETQKSPKPKELDSSSALPTKNNFIQNQSCEPMDIDETMPENVVLNDSDKSNHENVSLKNEESVDFVDGGINISKKNTKRKSNSNHSVNEKNTNMKDVLEHSKNISIRKSSLSSSISDENQNKSTLVLSQIKESEQLSLNQSKKDISLNVTDIEKDPKALKNNTNYSTSTPLQDKVSKKLLKQRGPINVSDIITKLPEKNEISKINKSESSEEDSSDDSDSESKLKTNDLVMDEAEEALEDYESGDSQDEDERQYERENEIVEKGETLTSGDEASNDTDYEKDSFVVSSDEEDNELLDGSDDDLTMSDNELSMSSKSKKKYNERKAKEQKKASREMFKSRHGLDDSKKRQSKFSDSESGSKLDSKLLDSDDDNSNVMKHKKSNRQRLDSTQDTSQNHSDTDESVKIKNKKSKKLSESMVNSDADESLRTKKKKVNRLSESVHEDVGMDEKEITIGGIDITEKDPLEKIKEEPKTPYHSFLEQNIESVEIQENVSIMKLNDSKDPLQATMAQDEDDDSSNISSNPEISSDYTNLLNNLPTIGMKEKRKDVSLNIDKKSNEKNKEPIVDQLNLTLTKNKKTKVTEKKLTQEKASDERNQEDEENSSYSIDMKLLFNEDSNDSDGKPKTNESNTLPGEDFIPLKRTEAKTNILNDSNAIVNESLKQSTKKKKKGNISVSEDPCNTVDKSLNASLKKKNKSNTSVTEELDKSTLQLSADETLNSSTKKKNKNISVTEDMKEMDTCLNITPNKSLNRSIKNKRENSISLANEDDEPVIIIHDSKGKKKHKNNNISFEDTNMNNSNAKDDKNKSAVLNESLNKSINTSVNKKLNVSKSNELENDDMPEEIPFKFDKNNQDNTVSIEGNTEKVKTPKSSKKDKKNVSITIQEEMNKAAALYDPASSSTEKKTSEQIKDSTQDATTEPETEISESGKKKRKRKKKTAKENFNANDDQSGMISEEHKNTDDTRKRKISVMSSFESTKGEDKSQLNVTNSSVGHKKKKQKLASVETNATTGESDIQTSGKNTRKRKKREEDDETKASKIMKETNDKSQVPRLPADIIEKLDHKPSKEILEQKKAIVSTSEFIVETAKIRKNKPSQYLEESIYLNEDTPEKKKQMVKLKKPKVLPFVPTATTSGFGFTTNFQVSIIPTETKFVAKTTEANFKNDYLQKKLKKFGTYELLKTQRKIKLSKF